MISFLALPNTGTAVIVSLFLVVFTGLLFLLILRGTRLRRARACLLPALILLLIGLDLLFLMEGQRSLEMNCTLSSAGGWVGSLPWALHALFLLLCGLYGGFAIHREKQAAEQEITPDSIREALDNMPSGLCFSSENGIPLLTNRKMYRLAEEASGRLCRNAEELWRELSGSKEQIEVERIEGGDAPTFRFSNGIYQFHRAGLTLQDRQYVQTTAADITRLHNLSCELAQDNVALDAQQKRLKVLLDEIVHTTREEEILASKVKIHNELGECLLSTRRNLTGEARGKDFAALLARWRSVARSMEISFKDADRPSDYVIQELMEAARALGCEIVFEGGTPEDAGRFPLLKNAIREAMTNAIRHAKADRLTVQVERRDGTVYAILRDNGKKQIASIVEGSGLSALRRGIEQAGGKLEIRCCGGVSLHIELPEKEEAL